MKAPPATLSAASPSSAMRMGVVDSLPRRTTLSSVSASSPAPGPPAPEAAKVITPSAVTTTVARE